jgi:hypothetical protein
VVTAGVANGTVTVFVMPCIVPGLIVDWAVTEFLINAFEVEAGG